MEAVSDARSRVVKRVQEDQRISASDMVEDADAALITVDEATKETDFVFHMEEVNDAPFSIVLKARKAKAHIVLHTQSTINELI
eukprot:CAMPEP_0204844164 /NCGR_PEP_ID=MMETSP1347-20130617/33_1 /ASSEMBLY_ACC=CAM_ASM_000690 /TAXON_ID=215587 /ORGANISM="Aplanochytrium stocchinoi, Strain GSBS06" /LENGTH=83 /DNA_ID=CAMNT_0051983451 /DNA_START=226 /DNA_END=474 /DNA_ORIENTATION=-